MATVHAQEKRGNVALLILDGTKAIFSSEGYGSDKKEALENSRKAVLRQILYDGVQDFNDGFPIVRSGRDTNLWLKGLFDEGKNAGYKTFLGDTELIGDCTSTPAGNYHCYTNVVINHKMLLQYAESQGVTKEGGVRPAPTQQKEQPKRKAFF